MKKVLVEIAAYSKFIIEIPENCELGSTEFKQYAQLGLEQVKSIPEWEVLDYFEYNPDDDYDENNEDIIDCLYYNPEDDGGGEISPELLED